MTESVEAARAFYSPILEEGLSGLEDVNPEDLELNKGSILVVIPPPATATKGGIELPDRVQESPSVGRIAAVPSGENVDLLPAFPGDWVVFRHGAGEPAPFQERKDLRILNYCEGMESDILGFIPQSKIDKEVPTE